jgi:hypothetical protein
MEGDCGGGQGLTKGCGAKGTKKRRRRRRRRSLVNYMVERRTLVNTVMNL